jgi:glycosyltransferase involved in cell wall biosynthesis
MLELPQRLFTPSAAARAVFERSGVPRGRIQVLANGVDAPALAARVEALRPMPAQCKSQVRIGVLGSVQPSKGVLEFARAVLALEDPELFVEVHGELIDYHGDASYARALREFASREPRLSLHGLYEHADLARVLAGLDAVAVPSLWNEVHGSTAREARAAGLHVFVSDRGGLAEWSVGDGVEILPAADPAAWRAALARFAQACRTPGARLVRTPSEPLRTAHELALELERHYVELVREQLGREPDLAFEAGSDARRSAAPAAGPTPSAAARWWRRLLGS